jgi:glycosyltransferase involved in cell wall biosynthesis
MSNPMFSIITPVTFDRDNADELRMPRYKMFQRCIASVQAQTFKDFVWVIADDKCNPSVENIPGNATIITLPEKSGRIIATNAALKESTGDWLCFLDADDEYSTIYLEALADAIRLNPEYKVFNMNHLIFDYDYKTWVRKFINMEVQGNLPFPSGVIGTGSYIFHRSVLEDVGMVPELGLWDLTNWFLEKYPEEKPFFEKKDRPGEYNSIGNPWGQDMVLWYMITRKYKAKYLDTALYYVHSRWGHRWPDDPDYVVDPGKAPELNPNNI